MQGEELAPSWSKGTFRRGIALRGLRRYDMAISAFAQGQDQARVEWMALSHERSCQDPSNPNWAKEIEETERMREHGPRR